MSFRTGATDCHVAPLLAMTRYGGFLFLSLRGGAKPRRGNPSPNSYLITHHS